MNVYERYLDLFVGAFGDYARYLITEIAHPSRRSYFYGLLVISLVVYLLELIAPWRASQKRIRRNFWLDGFYTFFNFFLFSLLGYHALSTVFVQAFSDIYTRMGIESLVAFNVSQWPVWAQLVAMFVLRDFIHYWVHRILHRSPRLWAFHEVHHSTVEMGFSAHLRYHWMETIVYRSLEYIPLAMIGFGIEEFFLVHITALAIGHLNHANLRLPIGPLRFILNSPQMHIWHHAKSLPQSHGVNFGLSLSVWDWLFQTAYWPKSGRDIALGFEGVEKFPSHFFGQMIEPFRAAKRGQSQAS